MKNPRTPNIRYWTGPSSILSYCGALAEQGLPDLLGDYWGEIPWLFLAIVLAAFFFGQIVSDYCNDSSWLRDKIRAFRSIFTIDFVVINSVVIDEHYNLTIRARIKIIKDTKNLKIVIRAHSDIDIKHSYEAFILETKDVQSASKDQVIDFKFVNIPVSTPDGLPLCYQSWGEPRLSGDATDMKPLYGANVVEINAKSGLLSQRELIFFNMMPDNESGRVFIAYGNEPSSLEVSIPQVPE